ncbi:hypothetical protein [Rhodopirellula sallentina]|uniref:Uncharacterized protein n=1 Tax=Rhodopirellula sallentina SM41 TaxID=1263870 RepID=M5UGH5_9BACT|nr:hypothetical protein [Rhodopirellula sallentina]EMI55113.1 hypothetical protein RSSM_03437 [Rhodopirellula sallentina SM41]
MNRKNPEHVIRIGNVSASVFARKIEKEGEPARVIRSVNLQKRYMDGASAKFSSSFGLTELPQAIEVLKRALQYVADAESVVAQVSSEPDDF